MPIQIPTIQANQTDQLHEPRVQAPGLDLQGVGQQLGTLDNAMTDVVRYQKQIEYQQADTDAQNARNEYLIWRKKKIYGDRESGEMGLINQKGDPRQAYADFDKEESQKLDDLAKGAGSSPMAQNVMNRRLSRAYQESKLETLTAYSHQHAKYANDTDDSAVLLAQQGMPGASSFIDADKAKGGDTSVYGPVDAKISSIRNTRIAQAIRNRTAVYSEDENDPAYLDSDGAKTHVKLGQSAIVQMNGDISAGLRDTVLNLYNTKNFDKAKAMQEHYADQIDSDDMAKILAHGKSTVDKEDAAQIADEALAKGKGNGAQWIMQNYTGLKRKEALEAFQSNARIAEADEDRRAKANFKDAYDAVANKGYVSGKQVEDDPDFQSRKQYLTPAQEKALKQTAQPPKESTDDAHIKMMNLLAAHNDDGSPSLQGMDQYALQDYKTDLNGKDRNLVDREWMKANKGVDPQKSYQLGRAVGQEVLNQGIGLRVYTKMPGSTVGNPVLTNDDQADLANDKKAIMGKVWNMGHYPSQKELSELVSEYFQDKHDHVPFNPQFKKFNGGSAGTKPPATAAAPSTEPSPQPTNTPIPQPTNTPEKAFGPTGNSGLPPGMNGPLTDKGAAYLWRKMSRPAQDDLINSFKSDNPGNEDILTQPGSTKKLMEYWTNKRSGKSKGKK